MKRSFTYRVQSFFSPFDFNTELLFNSNNLFPNHKLLPARKWQRKVDIEIFSCFGQLPNSDESHLRVGYLGENVFRNNYIELYDWALKTPNTVLFINNLDLIAPDNGIFWMPEGLRKFGLNIEQFLDDKDHEKHSRTGIVALVGNPNSGSFRNEILYRLIMNNPNIASAGKYLNNSQVKIPRGHSEMIESLSNFQFGLALENTSAKGYITEKIFQYFFAGVTPIYWGAPDIEIQIDPKCYLHIPQGLPPHEIPEFVESNLSNREKPELIHFQPILTKAQDNLQSAVEYINNLLLSITD